MPDIPEIEKNEPIAPDREPETGERQPRRERQPPYEPVKDNFKAITRIVHETHNILVKENSPFRFCVYKNNDNIFIDIVMLNEDGSVASTYRNNITEKKFLEMIDSIKSGKGLIIGKNI